ncbi:MAG: ABC transporter permease [Balneolales bacterium]
MSFFSLIADLLRNLSQQKLRTFLTIFGIMWGTATVIILLAFGFGLRDHNILQMRGMGDEIVILFQGRTTKAYQGYGVGRPIEFRENDAWLIRDQVRGIGDITPESTRYLDIRYGDKKRSTNLTGIYPVYGHMRNIFPDKGGRWINQPDVDDRRRSVFLGNGLKDLIFGDEEAIGKQVLIGDTPFTVIGVMVPKTQNSSYNQRDEDRAFIPATTFSTMFGTDRINYIIYTPASPVISKQVQADVNDVLSRRHRYDPDDEDAVNFWDTNDFWSFMYYFFLGFNLFLGIIGSFTLAVGGIGVANIMFVVVQERMKEIGIRRSAGAKRRTILAQFFTETFLIIGMGAALGYAIGWVVVQAMQHIPIREYVGTPQFSPEVGLIVFAVLALIGFSAGLLPAWRASRLNIIDCLRN